MPVLERPEITSFINSWRNQPAEQVAEELASYSLETKRIPDPYYFLITPTGELFSPTAHCKIKDKVEDKTSTLGQLEYQALLSIEQWAAGSNKGVVAWISPPYPGVYSTSKIIISEIEHEGGAKKLFNRALVFDFDEKECLELARNLAKFSQNMPMFAHLDQVRAIPLILNTHGDFWVHILEELIDDPDLWESIRNGDDRRAKKEALKEATKWQKEFFEVSSPATSINEVKAAVIQMLGPGQSSCPIRFARRGKTAFKVFSENSRTLTGSTSKDPDYCRYCPVCGEEINCIVRVGGSCPSCMAVKKCS